MLTTQFLLVNFHFVVSLLAALITLAIAWLYFDAWTGQKSFKQALPFLGFLFLSLSFVVQSVIVDQSLFETAFEGTAVAGALKIIFRFGGYLTLVAGQLITPLQQRPTRKWRFRSAALLSFLGLPVLELAPFLLAVLAMVTGLLYRRRAARGLERHLKPVSLGFFILGLAELLGVSIGFRDTANVALANLVAPFRPLWITERVILLIAIYIFGRWVWGYLLKRFETQLFMIFTTATLAIFLITTVAFSLASLANVRNSALESLRSDVGVIAYTVDSKKAEILADAQVVSQDPHVGAALPSANRSALATILTNNLLAKGLTTLTVVNRDAQVVIRAEDPEHFGESLSSDPLIQLALENRETSSVDTKEGTLAPVVTIRAAAPVLRNNQVIGAILISSDIDNAFVDGVKEATGLDASIYADNVRSATTFIAPDGKSRFTGIKEENETVKERVLAQGQTFEGSVDILSVPYFAVFSPLKSFDNNVVGMLFVGRPQTSILQTAARSIELTFSISAILLVLSGLPAYLISKYIAGQTV
ncbi:MAG: methyl-accepting chemotaxis protein [candidate division WWE3 bacterium CSP1-7]|uniref:Methyl-accepting chemotaxis protein n=1 Tax=candidate division WWE3 bacterium CSP1-7 TaxID=1576480 RepID=A0A0T5ZY94_UNCKA|nr:MAG: methyl-accepting chemotaxis protein [candidate division WWE3 bacterium CSP1-7]